MSFIRGLHGHLALGGILVGAPRVSGAFSGGATSIAVTGTTTLLGAFARGDQFTIAGETGSPVHTVGATADFYPAVTNTIASVPISPAIASGGISANAAITLVSNAVAQMNGWTISSSVEVLDTTCQGDLSKTCTGGVANWNGTGTVRLDISDLRQKALVDKILVGTPIVVPSAMTFGLFKNATTIIKNLYGTALLKDLSVASQLGSIVDASFSFEGCGPLLPTFVG